MNPKAWPPLRLFVLGAGVIGTVFCLGALIAWWRIPDAHRDGLELMAVAIAAGFFVVLVLPTLVLGLIGRWLVCGALLGLAVLVLTSDTLWHWLPWW